VPFSGIARNSGAGEAQVRENVAFAPLFSLRKSLRCNHNVSIGVGVIPSKSKSTGFSLVEVALAIGIVAFAFVALMSLLPAGLTTFRRALDISICTQIAQRIVGEAQQVDFDVLTDKANLPSSAQGKEYSFRMHRPGSAQIWIRYFDEQGNEIIPSRPPNLSAEETLKVIYAVNTRIVPRVTLPTGKEGFPVDRAAKETGNLALMTVQVARNPSGVELEVHKGAPDDLLEPERNLWMPKGGVDIFTYSAYIGKNQ
jgi:uncharacterized protein (TIGR02598 family)